MGQGEDASLMVEVTQPGITLRAAWFTEIGRVFGRRCSYIASLKSSNALAQVLYIYSVSSCQCGVLRTRIRSAETQWLESIETARLTDHLVNTIANLTFESL